MATITQERNRAWAVITAAVKEGSNKQAFYFLKNFRKFENGNFSFLEMQSANRKVIINIRSGV